MIDGNLGKASVVLENSGEERLSEVEPWYPEYRGNPKENPVLSKNRSNFKIVIKKQKKQP